MTDGLRKCVERVGSVLPSCQPSPSWLNIFRMNFHGSTVPLDVASPEMV
jgi:hypothetical protein